MHQDRTVVTKLSPEQEKWIVGAAMAEAFDIPDYPGLKAFAIREEGQPFQYALAQYRLGSTGKTLPDVKAWIKKKWDDLLKNNGVGQFMKDYDLSVARGALHKVFTLEIEQNKNKGWYDSKTAYDYIYDENSPPVKRALNEWYGMHQKPVAVFEKYVQDQRQAYYLNEGIKIIIGEKPKPTPAPKPTSPESPPSFKPPVSTIL